MSDKLADVPQEFAPELIREVPGDEEWTFERDGKFYRLNIPRDWLTPKDSEIINP